jgi:hypothetical protein
LLDPTSRVLRAKIAAHTLWASCPDRARQTQAARSAAFARFLDQVDPSLPEKERVRRAEHLRRAWMAKLAFQRERARSKARKDATVVTVAAAGGRSGGDDTERS